MAYLVRNLGPAGARVPRPTPGVRGESSPISEPLFQQFQALIYKESGIFLAAHKTALLTGRLARRLRTLGLSGMHEYLKLVTRPDQQHERAVMIDYITTNETHFFREPRHFEFLAQRVFPRWKDDAAAGRRPRRISIWSAGCSTGEEPYSLAMLLRHHFPEDLGWDLEVLATDISTRVLERARAALFPIEKSREIPTHYLQPFMLKGMGDQEGWMKASPEIHRMVRFARVNLNADAYPINGSFDLILCRNVLIYFDNESKKKAVSGLLRHLSPAGLLFVGHSENLHGVTSAVKSILPTVYAPTGDAGVPLHYSLEHKDTASGPF